jgi:hypothetical protein
MAKRTEIENMSTADILALPWGPNGAMFVTDRSVGWGCGERIRTVYLNRRPVVEVSAPSEFDLRNLVGIERRDLAPAEGEAEFAAAKADARADAAALVEAQEAFHEDCVWARVQVIEAGAVPGDFGGRTPVTRQGHLAVLPPGWHFWPGQRGGFFVSRLPSQEDPGRGLRPYVPARGATRRYVAHAFSGREARLLVQQLEAAPMGDEEFEVERAVHGARY